MMPFEVRYAMLDAGTCPDRAASPVLGELVRNAAGEGGSVFLTMSIILIPVHLFGFKPRASIAEAREEPGPPLFRVR